SPPRRRPPPPPSRARPPPPALSARRPPARARERAPAPEGGAVNYERDPARIYAQSFATVRAEAALGHLPPDVAELAVRLIHACGMTDLPAGLAFSPDVAASARAALAAGRPIFCDCDMVAAGIIRRALPPGVETVVTVHDPRAVARGNTRSAA